MILYYSEAEWFLLCDELTNLCTILCLFIVFSVLGRNIKKLRENIKALQRATVERRSERERANSDARVTRVTNNLGNSGRDSAVRVTTNSDNFGMMFADGNSDNSALDKQRDGTFNNHVSFQVAVRDKGFSDIISGNNVAELIEKQLDDIFDNIDVESVNTEVFQNMFGGTTPSTPQLHSRRRLLR